jgi:hypothetical protein
MMKEILYEKIEQSLAEKEYNHQKAQKIAEWNNADHSGSLRNDSETLYASEEGNYFIIYEGGLYSRFHELPGVVTWFGGSYTRSVSLNDAYVWCQETGNYDAIKEHLPFFMMSIREKV